MHCLHLCLVYMLVQISSSEKLENFSVNLTSSESTISVVFDIINPENDSYYMLRHHRANGIFMTDLYIEHPFQKGHIQHTIPNLYPGVDYSIYIFRNKNDSDGRIFMENIHTVPLAPVDLNVTNVGSTWMTLDWERGHNSSQTTHEIRYTDLENSGTRTVTGSENTAFNLTDLDSGHRYSISVMAVAGVKKSNKSDSINDSTAPAAPTNVVVSAVNTTHLSLTWQPAPNSLQDSYKVTYISPTKTEEDPVSCSSEPPCVFQPGGLPGDLFTVKVYAIRLNRTSDPAVQQHNTQPRAVTNLQGSAGVRSITVTWGAPDHSLVEFYKVRVVNTATTVPQDFNVSLSSEEQGRFTFSEDNLQGGVSHNVIVYSATRTEDSIGHTKLLVTVPESPTGLTGTVLNTTAILLSWTLPTSSSFEQIQIQVTKPDLDVVNITLPKEDTSKIIVNLIAGTTYDVSVFVLTKVVSSAPVGRQFRTKPDPPSITSVVAMDISATVDLAKTGDGITEYFVAAIASPNPTERNVSLDSPSTEFENLQEGTSYVVTAYSVSGDQKSVSVTRTFFTKPRPPSQVNVTAFNSTAIDVTWSLPDRGSHDNFTVILVQSDGTSQHIVSTTTSTSVSFPMVEAGQTYNVTVITNLGHEESEPVLKQVTTTPFPITQLWVSSRSPTKVVVNWDAPTGTLYDYFVYDFPGSTSMQHLPRDQFQLVLDKLEPGQNFTIKLYAASKGVTEDQLSNPTTLNFVTYPDTVATLQKIEANTTAIHVNWTAPSSTSHFDYYVLTITPPDGPEPITSRGEGDTTIWFGGLRPGQLYNITINTRKDESTGPIWGIQTHILAVTEPESVTSYEVKAVDNETISAKWIVNPQSQQDFFSIEYTSNGQTRTSRVQFVPNQIQYEVLLPSLLSGYTYNVSAKAVRSLPPYDIGFSAEMWQTATTYPRAVVGLMAAVEGRTVRLEWEPAASSRQDLFRVDYHPVLSDAAAELLQINTTEPRLDFPELFNGEMYEFRVYAVSKNMISDMTQQTAVIAPLAPPDFSVIPEQTTTSGVTLGWTYMRNVTFVQRWTIGAHNDTFTLPAMVVNATSIGWTTFSFTDLRPGAKYYFEITAQSERKRSSPVRINTTVRPVLTITWSESDQQTSNTSIVFRYQLPNSDELFERVRFSVNGSTLPPVFLPKNNARLVSFSNLIGGTLYNVEAVSEVAGLFSDPEYLSIRTRPNAVQLSHTSSPNEISIQFYQLIGNADKFVVTCDFGGTSCWNHDYPSNTQHVTIRKLQPYTQYTITVATVAGNKNETETFTVATKQAAPSEVQNVHAIEVDLHTVKVTWSKPMYLNGVLTKYVVSYSGYDPTINADMNNGTQNVNHNKRSVLLVDLKAGFHYNITVQAVTVAMGEAGYAIVTLKTANPSFKAGQDTARPRLTTTEPETVGETYLKVTFPNAFSDTNGRVIQYTVIVTSDLNDPELSDNVLPSWNDAQKRDTIKTYQTIKNCSDFFAVDSSCGHAAARHKRAADSLTYRVFTVGAETNCAEVDYCNGPLKPETEYYFKLRAYTTGGYADTEYSQKMKTAAAPSNVGGIVGGVVAAIVIIGVIVAVLIFLRRRRPKRAHKYTGERTTIEQSSLHKFSRAVKLADFKDHVRRMAADSDFRYAEEYEDLKEVGRDQSCLAAEFPPNRPKNRFTNILPYDHSRVKLLPTDDEEGSDYINANYVPGYMSKREYIATQGPLPSTRDDFWRMVWEQNCRNIVMLTKCMEKGREKSDHYWPTDSEPKFYGDLQVAILNETHLPDWTLSEFRMQFGDQVRQIRHFHYKSWPDFGVPKDPTSLIRFVRMVRERMFREGGPVITHCSAGVGRSGTFIVLDHTLQLIKDQDTVDIYQIVYKLRKERVSMVQTEQQYKFIHECLLCVIEGREDDAMYANVGHINVAYDDDEGINVEVP